MQVLTQGTLLTATGYMWTPTVPILTLVTPRTTQMPPPTSSSGAPREAMESPPPTPGLYLMRKVTPTTATS